MEGTRPEEQPNECATTVLRSAVTLAIVTLLRY